MKIIILLPLMLCWLILTGCMNNNPVEVISEPVAEIADETAVKKIIPGFDQFSPPVIGEEYAVITTDFGKIELKLFPEFAPMAVENFITHAKNGYYDGLVFHRIVKDFMIQTGDPEGTGTGGESIWGEGFHIEPDPNLRHFNGALCMARGRDRDSQGSQFYIVQNNELDERSLSDFNDYKKVQDEELKKGSGILIKDYFPTPMIDKYTEYGGVPRLDFGYTVFGQVFSGMDAVNAIAAVEVAKAATGEMSKPINDVYMNKVEIKTYGN